MTTTLLPGGFVVETADVVVEDDVEADVEEGVEDSKVAVELDAEIVELR